MRPKVVHIIAEFCGCKSNLISRSKIVKRILDDAVKRSKLTPIRSYFHQFSPYGVTGFILLKESHISIHTWPEYNYAAIDLFGCGDRKNILDAHRFLVRALKPAHVRVKEIKRGV